MVEIAGVARSSGLFRGRWDVLITGRRRRRGGKKTHLNSGLGQGLGFIFNTQTKVHYRQPLLISTPAMSVPHGNATQPSRVGVEGRRSGPRPRRPWLGAWRGRRAHARGSRPDEGRRAEWPPSLPGRTGSGAGGGEGGRTPRRAEVDSETTKLRENVSVDGSLSHTWNKRQGAFLNSHRNKSGWAKFRAVGSRVVFLASAL